MLDRKGEHILLPGPDVALKPGDQLLFVGNEEALKRQQTYLQEPSSVQYVRTGVEPGRGWVFRNVRKWWNDHVGRGKGSVT